MALAIPYPIDSWLTEHISILLLLQHPLISVVGFVITLVLFARLLVAIATLIDRLWLWILRLPINLFQSIFAPREKTKETIAPTINYELSTNLETSEQILQKLNAIEQQQKRILQDLATLKKNSQSSQAKKTKLIKQIKGQT
ncbi:hypothetical protein Xen7305DRAFT_00002760 [Xenococcus sp. PCC 7305]|uniref:hypothetical protein n=1 Tax=Xenococcus sp. PCC 7305 TaxID=102125 RepID=UPI0002AC0855|nr:hypothetical protein [Xenococcus sp. PCC 7305]ELS00575.1 hypothetical protein Xen7305DRAFT_00002760 [Xenococcus sp. PCC 7305]